MEDDSSPTSETCSVASGTMCVAQGLGDEAGARLGGLVPLGAQPSMWWSVARSAFTGIVRARPTPRISMMPRMPQ